MAAEGQQVHSQLLGGEGHLQKALDRVTVEQGGTAGALDGPGRLRHRQDGAQLVVHQHHGHQHRVRAKGLLQIGGGDVPLAVRPEVGHLIALALQRLAGLQHRGVLDGGGDDVLPLPLSQLRGGLNGPVVALGAAGGEHHLLRGAAQSPGHVGTPLLHPCGRLAAQGVAGGGVAPALAHGLHRRLDGLRPHRGGGRVVQIMHHGSRLRCLSISRVFSGLPRSATPSTCHSIRCTGESQGGQALFFIFKVAVPSSGPAGWEKLKEALHKRLSLCYNDNC